MLRIRIPGQHTTGDPYKGGKPKPSHCNFNFESDPPPPIYGITARFTWAAPYPVDTKDIPITITITDVDEPPPAPTDITITPATTAFRISWTDVPDDRRPPSSAHLQRWIRQSRRLIDQLLHHTRNLEHIHLSRNFQPTGNQPRHWPRRHHQRRTRQLVLRQNKRRQHTRRPGNRPLGLQQSHQNLRRNLHHRGPGRDQPRECHGLSRHLHHPPSRPDHRRPTRGRRRRPLPPPTRSR